MIPSNKAIGPYSWVVRVYVLPLSTIYFKTLFNPSYILYDMLHIASFWKYISAIITLVWVFVAGNIIVLGLIKSFHPYLRWAKAPIPFKKIFVCFLVLLFLLKSPLEGGDDDSGYQPLFWCQRKQKYWCYYPHRPRDSMSPVCGIIFFLITKLWN